MMRRPLLIAGALLALASLAAPATAQTRARCGTPARVPPLGTAALPPSDCGYWTNVPAPQYQPSFFYDIPVVFHVIQHGSGAGFLDAATIQDQIDVLNEDFQALPGTPGAPGTDGRIRFHLATVDPQGQPTTGITYTTNSSWYQDSGDYWTPLHWDTDRYLNVYTNAPPCCFGYVPDFPSAGGLVGQAEDRVVLWWEAVGREPTAGWPLNMGRTATHEIGHYLGLYHTFDGCGNNCSTDGDLICDTNPQSSSTSGCPGAPSSCGSPDPFHNYMDYTDDPCLWEFTPEQVQRMRCTLEHWRPDLSLSVGADEVVRLGTPPNPPALLPGQTSGPLAGGIWDPVVDHAAFAPGATADVLIVSLGATEIPLGAKGTLLCDLPALVMISNFAPGTPFLLPVPNDGSILGVPFCAQVASTGGAGPTFQLTNALDCVIGNS